VKWSASEKGKLCSATKLLNNVSDNITLDGRKSLRGKKKGDTGEDMAHCKLCNTNFSVAAGALYDVKRHAKRSTHVTAVEGPQKPRV
jgi:hypothetical protein